MALPSIIIPCNVLKHFKLRVCSSHSATDSTVNQVSLTGCLSQHIDGKNAHTSYISWGTEICWISLVTLRYCEPTQSFIRDQAQVQFSSLVSISVVNVSMLRRSPTSFLSFKLIQSPSSLVRVKNGLIRVQEYQVHGGEDRFYL